MTEKEYDVVVIGAGVAGLVSALKLSQEGRRLLLLERQNIPGGYAASFKRANFIFEAAIHCADELGDDGYLREFLDEYSVAPKLEFIPLKNFSRVIFPEHDFLADFNQDNFAKYLKVNFPHESGSVDRFMRMAQKFDRQMEHFAHSELPMWFKLLISPFRYGLIVKSSMFTTKQLVDKFFRDDKLKSLITEVWRYAGLPPSKLSAFYFLIIFCGYYCNSTCSVRGGFTKLYEAMIKAIEGSGSDVLFNASVTRIITDQGRSVKGVMLKNGQVIKARAVVSNANPFLALTELLDDDALKDTYRKKLSSFEKSISAVQVYLGLKIPAKDLGMSNFMLSVYPTYDHEESFRRIFTGDYNSYSFCIVDHAQIDPTLVPQGKGSLVIMVLDSYANWKGLKDDDYQRKKKEVAEILLNKAENYLPGLSKSIEVMEVATPLTFQRYSLSPEGAIYGFSQTVLQSSLNRLPLETKVKGLFLTGAWTKPGHGVHGCFVSGMDAADAVLGYLKRRKPN